MSRRRRRGAATRTATARTSSGSARPRRRWSNPRREVRHHLEVKADPDSNEAVNDFDWEGYLDNQAAAAPMPSYKSNNGNMPSLEATLTRGTSLFDHLEWQLKLSHFTLEEDGIAMLIMAT